MLQELLGRRTVTCYQRDIDRYGRFVGQCFVGAVDINEWLVAQGLALAYRRYSRNYVAAEDEARQARFGMWAGTFRAAVGMAATALNVRRRSNNISLTINR